MVHLLVLVLAAVAATPATSLTDPEATVGSRASSSPEVVGALAFATGLGVVINQDRQDRLPGAAPGGATIMVVPMASRSTGGASLQLAF